MPAVVGVFSVTVIAPFADRTGCGDGQGLGLSVQAAGMGPIVVVSAPIVPSSGFENDCGWIVMVAFWAGCEVPAQTRLKFTVLVTVWPGPMAPRSINAWLPGRIESPSAGTVSAKTAVAEIRNATTARAAARRISLSFIVRAF